MMMLRGEKKAGPWHSHLALEPVIGYVGRSNISSIQVITTRMVSFIMRQLHRIFIRVFLVTYRCYFYFCFFFLTGYVALKYVIAI
jgi:hypothetical protein